MTPELQVFSLVCSDERSVLVRNVVVDSLVFLFFEYLGSSYTVMGMTVLLTVSFEIPIFRVAPSLLERLGSGRLLLVASFCYISRAVGYSCIPKGHILYVLGLEPLHGVTYACSQVSFVVYMGLVCCSSVILFCYSKFSSDGQR